MSSKKFFRVAVAIGVPAVFASAATARDDGRYAGSPLKGWFDTLKSSDCAVRMRMASRCRTPTGNPGTATTASVSMANGSSFPRLP